MNKDIFNDLKNDLKKSKDVFAIVVYGSHVEGKAHERSDMDACVVLKTNDGEKLSHVFREILKISAKNEKYDIRIFEQMPLFMKMEVIEKGQVIYTKDFSELNEYFYFIRKLWQDQSVNWIYK